MGKDRRGFQLLEGYRRAVNAPPHARTSGQSKPQQNEGCLPVHLQNARQEDLVEALTTMEQRLSTLLENRSRISQDLHDCVLQSLYAIGLHLETSHRKTPNQSLASEESHRVIVGQINQLIHEVRRMVHELNQDQVPEFDLADELRTMQTTYEHIGLVRIILKLEPAAIEVLTKEEEREILNIVREALSNCLRHAHATHAKIAIRKCGEKITVTIRDDGTGFATTTGSVKRGYGLANMEARAKKIGGTLLVRSELGHGTDITAEFLLEPNLVSV